MWLVASKIDNLTSMEKLDYQSLRDGPRSACGASPVVDPGVMSSIQAP